MRSGTQHDWCFAVLLRACRRLRLHCFRVLAMTKILLLFKHVSFAGFIAITASAAASTPLPNWPLDNEHSVRIHGRAVPTQGSGWAFVPNRRAPAALHSGHLHIPSGGGAAEWRDGAPKARSDSRPSAVLTVAGRDNGTLPHTAVLQIAPKAERPPSAVAIRGVRTQPISPAHAQKVADGIKPPKASRGVKP